LAVRAAEESPVQRSDEGRRLEGRVDFAAAVEDALERFPRTRSEIVKHGDLVNAGDGAERRAGFGAGGFAPKIVACVGFERDGRMAALL
jgi:hypothetical protein